MSRNGSGTYVLPSGNPVITGTTISSSVQNTTMTDVSNALTTSISVDGQSVIIGNIPMAGYKFTGLRAGGVAGDSVRFEQLADTQAAVSVAIQKQTYTAFPSTGTAPNYVVTPSPAVTLVVNTRLTVTANAGNLGAATTFNVSGTGAFGTKQYDSTGTKVDPTIVTGQIFDLVYDGTNWVIIDPLPTSSKQIQTIPTPTLASNAMTIPGAAFTLDFRSATLTSPVITTVTGTPASLVVPSGATLGTVSAIQSDIYLIALNNAGTIEYAVTNASGGVDLSETGVISTTAISAGSTSASVVYSTAARTSVAYRVVGVIRSTQTTAGQWAQAISLLQGFGGQALAAMSSLGYGQNWQDVKSNRAWSTTYYNTTGKPRLVSVRTIVNTVQDAAALSINSVIVAGSQTPGGGGSSTVVAIVPPNGSYSLVAATSGTAGTIQNWTELF